MFTVNKFPTVDINGMGTTFVFLEPITAELDFLIRELCTSSTVNGDDIGSLKVK